MPAEVGDVSAINKAVVDLIGDICFSNSSASNAAKVCRPAAKNDDKPLVIDRTPLVSIVLVVGETAVLATLGRELFENISVKGTRSTLQHTSFPRRQHLIELRGLLLRPRVIPVLPSIWVCV